jgi:hypothetical protein
VLKTFTQQLARGARSVVRRVEVTLHDQTTSHKGRRVHNGNPDADTISISSFVFLLLAPGFKPGASKREIKPRQKKTGRKINSPPGLKLGIVIPKAFGIVIKRRALMPLFLR